MKYIIVLLVTLLMSHDLYAADFKTLAPYVALVAGESADTLTTYRFLQGKRCVEGNSHLGRYPSAGRLIIWTAIPVGTTALATYLMTRPEMPKPMRVAGKLLSYGAGAWGGYNAGRNVKNCGW
jgi:hypothetical protein